jgi:beta-glucosidase
VNTWGANLKINIGTEEPVDYQSMIKQLDGIDKVIFVGGISSALEGEEMPVQVEGFKGGDRTNIELPQVQRDFLKALHEAGKKVIFVCCSGSAIALEPETATCDAILQSWYAGQEGGEAIADVLYGDYNPSGKLPVTFYKSTAQLPAFEDYGMKGRTYRYMNDALYPFGYGLSYTFFKIGKAQLSTTVANVGETVNLQIPVANEGKQDGTEIIQVYVKDINDADGPIKSLKAFRRVDVKAGATTQVDIPLSADAFTLWDAQTNTMRAKPGKYQLYYGNSSADNQLKSLQIELK